MKLLRLEVNGFKSFPDKASIDFVQDGVSIVVGPNGCGKSNIVDAIRWALGEQSAKHLRGATMEDVIFAGSSSRKQVGLAQVTLVFSNPFHDTISKYSEYTEIAVCRRLFRTGESGYMINKTNCRLADIRELFMDTGIGGKGYSIIEQGKIDRIVTSNPAERRSLIDEAAGIVKFKAKKADALKRFSTSRANLERVEDVLRELRIQEERLVVQVEQADAYTTAKGRIERLSQLSASHQWEKLKVQADKQLDEKNMALQKAEDLSVQLAKLATQKEGVGLELSQQQTKKEEQGAQVTRNRERLIKLESQIEKDVETLRHLGDWQVKGTQELEQIEGQIEALFGQEEALIDANQSVQAEQEQAQSTLSVAQEEIKVLAERLSEQEAHNKAHQELHLQAKVELANKTGEVSRHEDRLKEARKRGQEAKEALVLAAERLITAEENRTEVAEKLAQKRAQQEQVATELETSRTKLLERQSALEAQNRKIDEQEKEYTRAESRLASLKQLQQNHEDFAPTIKRLLDHFAEFPEQREELGFVGPLADVIEVESKLESWTENLLGRHFNLLLFESHYHLTQIKGLMEQLEIGHLEIYFLDLCPAVKSNLDFLIPWRSKPEGLYLSGHYQALEKRSHQIEPLDLEKERNLLLNDQALLSREGVFHLGLPSEAKVLEGYLNRQKEFHQLSASLTEMKQKVEDLVYDQGWIKEEVKELDWTVTDLSQQHQQLEIEVRETAKELEGWDKDCARLAEDQERLQNARDQQSDLDVQLEKQREQAVLDIEGAQQLLAEMDDQKAEGLELTTEIRLLWEQKKGERQQLEVAAAALKEKSHHQKELARRIQEDLKGLQARHDQTKTQSQDHSKQRAELEANVVVLQDQQPQLVETIQRLETSYRELTDQLESQGHQVRQIENEEKELRTASNLHKEKAHQFDLKLAQLAQEGVSIEQKLFEDWGVRPAEVLQLSQNENFDPSGVNKEISQLKARLQSLGDVNLGAKKEYDELKVRLDFLAKESTDLSQSISALEDSIQKIDSESKRRFNQTFERINKEFHVLFPTLFGGGEAFLRLSEPDNLLDSGVEIIAQPPGKKLQNMTLLSGGEKAMTALALIFSIFQFKPSPFCLLDEVDAPLDDGNNRRFNSHVKALTQNSQFIIITHNKKTMEIGDAMFGVTMEEPGVSKIVSVDFTSAQALVS